MPSQSGPTPLRHKRPLYLVIFAAILVVAVANILAGFPSGLKKAQAEPTIDDPCGISGWVFNDRNADGVFQYGEPVIGSIDVQSSEPGIGGAPVELERPNGVAVDDTLSFAGPINTGWFRFQGLAPQVYRVIETDLAGWVSVSPNRQVVPLQVNCVAEVFFGDRRVNSIAGVVFEDINGNRRQDQGEPGIPGAAITITPQGGGAPIASLTTDQYGAYEANNVPAGRYVVEETDPAGYISLSPNKRNVNLKAGGFETANFADASVNNSITGVVFQDMNGNGQQDPGDEGLSAWDVTLDTAAAAGANVTIQTNEQGQYAFARLAANVYTVSSAVPAGFTAISPAEVEVAARNNQVAQANFALGDRGSIAGVVFLDQNGDGVQQWTELGLPNVEMDLRAGGVVIQTTGTSPSGSYSFGGLGAGTYRVDETNPAGLASTTADSVQVVLPANGAAFANFGDQEAGSVSGIVFQDENGNGARDLNEPGIFGAKVALKNAQGSTIRTATTFGNGFYLFELLPPAEYTVVQTDLPGFRSTTANEVQVFLLSDATAAANFGDKLEGEEFVYIPRVSNYVSTTR